MTRAFALRSVEDRTLAEHPLGDLKIPCLEQTAEHPEFVVPLDEAGEDRLRRKARVQRAPRGEDAYEFGRPKSARPLAKLTHQEVGHISPH
jgi:hypothetical protein